MSITRSGFKGIRNPKKVVAGITHKWLSLFSHNEYRRFIVLSRSRTGSNMLISFLNSHPNIQADGEIFSKLSGRNTKDVLAKAFTKQPLFVKAKGFKIFYYHPLDDKASGVWDALASLNDLHVIHLKRRNILHTLVSRKIADIQDVWVVRSADQHSGADRREITVAFSVDELSEGFKQTREWEQFGEDTFRNHLMISIEYEDLVAYREPTFRKLTEFLGVRYVHPTTQLIKQNTKSMKETIMNYEELKSAFSETEWHPFFDE
jgi:LPS sulfotransferase NodH